MQRSEFLLLLEQLLELEPGTLKGGELLAGIGWSSLAVIGFIALADEHFGVSPPPSKLAKCRTTDDLQALLGERVLV